MSLSARCDGLRDVMDAAVGHVDSLVAFAVRCGCTQKD